MPDRPWFAHYDPGVPRSLAPYPNRTLLDYLADAVRDHGAEPFIWYKGAEISFAEVQRTADAFAAALVAMGVARGDRVALLLPNCPQFVIAELAIWKVGAIAAPLNPTYTDDDLSHTLETSSPKVVVTLNPFYENVKKVQAKAGVARVVTTRIQEYFPTMMRWAFSLFMERKMGHSVTRRDGDLEWGTLVRANLGAKAQPVAPAATDDALILMSGGTTGRPKGVIGRHESLVMTAMQFRAWLKSSMEDGVSRFVLPLPMFHSYGAVLAMPSAVIGRNVLALVPNPRDLGDVVKTIDRVQPAFFAGVPTLYNALLNHKDVKSGKVSFRSLKVCASGAAPLMAETKKQFEGITGARITEAYALTESLIAGCGNPIVGPSKTGSVGMPLPDVDVVIVDADDWTKELPNGETGEILLRGPQMMRGYWKDEAETALMVIKHPDGVTWLHTADLGYLDPDGYLFIVDRKKDLMKPNGMQVWPREVEEAISAHPAVAEVGVRSFPDAARGEIVVAFVVLKAGASATEAEIRSFARDHLAHYKVPAKVVFRRELPKTLVGKVLRRKLTLEEPVPAS